MKRQLPSGRQQQVAARPQVAQRLAVRRRELAQQVQREPGRLEPAPPALARRALASERAPSAQMLRQAQARPGSE
ncbi:hypothetical protein QPK31_23225 [Massilia sp. YIM B02769]|uniref:hypothetical protein n=1 Tax=Massilia sp. YIM B02769 TaxID=3050129 RepID=UPI0025B66FFF|nr:hypothetical protein [Massilia sp. YIM B02769]MDN4061135.1 hypothetical protein [Massilia sp. YIM B02769]